MFMGIDYPFWATFNLRSVFPKLEDSLKNFPSSQMYNAILLGWPTLKNEIGSHLFSTPDLMRKIDTLYGAYLVALSKGAAPYKASVSLVGKYPIVSAMQAQTGFSRAVVVAFLNTLEKLARAGTISQKYWDPDRAVAQDKVIVQRQKEAAANAPKGPLDKVAEAGKWLGLGALGLFGLGAMFYLKPFRRG